MISLSFNRKLSQTSQSSTKSSLKTYQGDVRLFVGKIPQQVTQVYLLHVHQWALCVIEFSCANFLWQIPTVYHLQYGIKYHKLALKPFDRLML